MATATVDTTTLTSIINQCFANSMDEQYTEDQQSGFLLDGKRLRGQLVNLLSAQFDAGSGALQTANTSLKALNTQLTDSASALAHAAAVLTQIAALVTNLDSLLSTAVSFV